MHHVSVNTVEFA